MLLRLFFNKFKNIKQINHEKFIYNILFFSFIAAQKVDKKDEKTKSYNSIVDSEVITDEGLFKVHKRRGVLL